MHALRLGILACAVGGVFAARPASALTINLGNTSGMNTDALAGFQAAANYWSSTLSNNVTINIDVGYQSLGAGILGSTQSSYVSDGLSYNSVKKALSDAKTSSSDITAVSHLQNGSSLTFKTTNLTTGATYTSSGPSTMNTKLDVTTANARVLGLYSGAGTDATITFTSNYQWDFDRSDGIAAGKYDFIGCAIHEIGHALGFVSGVDVIDYYAAPNGSGKGKYTSFSNYEIVTPLDLFRYGTDGTTSYMSMVDGDAAYFSLDGGATSLASFSTGVYNGDGRQASHWKDNLGLGIMDPTAAPGELMAVTPLDLQAMDIIGYTVAAVPEPATAGMLLILGAGSLLCRRRKA